MDIEIIIVEGSDCAGKTSLIESLSEHYGFDIVKGSSFEHSQCTQSELLNKFLDMTNKKRIILDRFIYSNEVYASLYDDYAILSDEERRYIETIIKDKSVLIYLKADTPTLVNRMNVRGDEYVTVDKLQSIKDKYEESMNKVADSFNMYLIEVDTTNLSKEETTTTVVQAIDFAGTRL